MSGRVFAARGQTHVYRKRYSLYLNPDSDAGGGERNGPGVFWAQHADRGISPRVGRQARFAAVRLRFDGEEAAGVAHVA